MSWGNKEGEKRETERGHRRKKRETRKNWRSYLLNRSLGNDHIWTGPYEVVVSDGLTMVKMLRKMKKRYG